MWDTASGLLYAADNTNRFYVSYNKGRTWRRHGSRIPYKQRPNVSHFCSLASFIENGRRTFYVTSSYPGKIFRTRDTGQHWQCVFSDSVFRNREIPKLGKLSDGRYFACSAEGIIDAPGSVLIGNRDGYHWKIVPAPEGLWYFDELPSHPGYIVAGGFSLGRNAGDAALFLTKNYGRLDTLGDTCEWALTYSPDQQYLAPCEVSANNTIKPFDGEHWWVTPNSGCGNALHNETVQIKYCGISCDKVTWTIHFSDGSTCIVDMSAIGCCKGG